MHIILRNGQGRKQFEVDAPDDKATTVYYLGEPILVIEPDASQVNE